MGIFIPKRCGLLSGGLTLRAALAGVVSLRSTRTRFSSSDFVCAFYESAYMVGRTGLFGARASPFGPPWRALFRFAQLEPGSHPATLCALSTKALIWWVVLDYSALAPHPSGRPGGRCFASLNSNPVLIQRLCVRFLRKRLYGGSYWIIRRSRLTLRAALAGVVSLRSTRTRFSSSDFACAFYESAYMVGRTGLFGARASPFGPPWRALFRFAQLEPGSHPATLRALSTKALIWWVVLDSNQ